MTGFFFRVSAKGAQWLRNAGLKVLFAGLAIVLPDVSFASTFSWSLSQAGLTSGGIYGADGKLVRVLWTMESMPAGSHQSNWDGLDDNGNLVPADNYSWKVVVNRTVYNNIGTVGNTGTPSTSFGHVPFFMEGVAVDAQNSVYTVHDWNEAGHDIKRWNPSTGLAEFNTGHIIGEALLKGIAVEPDGSRAYVTGYGDADVNDRANIKFSLYRVNLATSSVEDFTQAGRRVLIRDGNSQYPAGATASDIEVMKVPVVSVALAGGSVYVTDSLGGRVLKYDKVTGALQQEISGIPLACGLAVGSDGRIWVGHEHTKVSVYSSAGVRLATPVDDLVEVRALAIQGGTMCVADRNGQIRKYSINGNGLTLLSSFGQRAQPGEKRPDRLSAINGMAMDASGGVIVSDRMGGGSRLQKLDAGFSQVWQQMGLEFSSQAAFGQANPDVLISSYRNVYQINRATGGWTLLGPGGTDKAGSYFGNFDSTHFGPPRVVRFGNNDFFYYPAGDGVAVYKLTPPDDPQNGPTLKLASCLGGSMPSPDGVSRDKWWLDENKYLWSWDDTQGDGEIQYTSAVIPGEVTLDASPGNPEGWKWDKASMGVDDEGWVWLASYARIFPPGPFEAKAIYAIAPQGLNTQGNPVYRWANAVKVMDEATGRDALGVTGGEFNWMMVNRSDDGMVYSLAYSDNARFPQDGARWMGGNVLFGFEGQTSATPSPLGAPKWHVVLPERSVGMSPIPGGKGGVLVGVGPTQRGTIGHYTKDGLLIGKFSVAAKYGDDTPPNLASGALDSFMAINCHRDPRDGVLDVFAEDNWNQRLVWYRVNDSQIETLSGSVAADQVSGPRHTLGVTDGIGDGSYTEGTVVSITAETPPAGKVFKAWTGDTQVLASSTAAVTTVTMPASDVNLTATFDWATGNDMIRFYAREGDEHRMVNCIFEGTNGDPVEGPYTPFYIVTTMPAAGWTEVSVDLANYRYLRFRDPNTNGLLTELEFYRDGSKLTGTGFGTAGSWNNESNRTFAAALDGDLDTYFNGPGPKNAYVGIDTGASQPSAHVLTVTGGSGGGSYETGTVVTITANAAPAGTQFAGWTGDTAILANPSLPTTSAIIPSVDVSATATYTALETVPPTLTRVYLRQVHGPSAIFDLDVFGPGTVSNIEPRKADMEQVRTLVLEFDQDVMSGTVAVELGQGSVLSAAFEGNRATVTLVNLGDRQKVSLRLTGFAGNGTQVMPAMSVPIRFLIGDANRDGKVNAADQKLVRDQTGKTYLDAGFKYVMDFETDGYINSADAGLLKDNFGFAVAP